MKISAINSNYETKKSLKKNEIKNNANMSAPSFEGMNKLNKVSAKKLALALAAGLAVATPSLQSCYNKQNTSYSITNDAYINSKVTKKYPEINPEDHKNFDLSKDAWVSKKYREIVNYPLFNSLDTQLLNYYVQNPEEKKLPSNETIQGFLDNYNKNKEFDQKVANFEQAQNILNQYKEISKKYKITEQEAVWNFPSRNRKDYIFTVEKSLWEHYRLSNSYISPTPEHREDIQIGYYLASGGRTNNLEYCEKYSSRVIDEIHRRVTNSEIHKKMLSSESQGSDYDNYIDKDYDKIIEEIEKDINNTTTNATTATNTNKTSPARTVDKAATPKMTNKQRDIRIGELYQKEIDLNSRIYRLESENITLNCTISDNYSQISYNNSSINTYNYLSTSSQSSIQHSNRAYGLATETYQRNYWTNSINNNLNSIDNYSYEINRLTNENAYLMQEIQMAENTLAINNIELEQAKRDLEKITKELNELE